MADINVNIKLNDDTSLNIDKTNGLKSVESLSESTGQPKDIFYGVVPSSGSLEIIDINGNILEMVKNGAIPNSNVKVDLFANGKKIQNHITTDSDYSINDKILKIDLSNTILDLDKLIFDGFEFGGKIDAFTLISKVFTSLGKSNEEIEEMFSEKINYGAENTSGSIKDYLSEIILESQYLERATYRETIDKFCTLAQLNMLCDDNGNFKFVSSRPLTPITNLNKAIKITPKQIIGNTQNTVITKNKYDGIDISVSKININENLDTVAYEKSISDFTKNLSTTQDHNTAMDNHGTAGGYYFAFALMKNTYMDISFYIPKFSNSKLKEITSLNDGLRSDEYGNKFENITYTMEYSKETGTASAYATYNGIYRNPSVVNTSYQTFDKFNGQINSNSFTHTFGSASITVKANDISNITQSGILTTYDNEYEIKNLKILVGKELIGVGADGSFENWEDKSIGWNGNCTLYKATKLKISFNGDVKEISFDYIEDNSPNIENATTIATISQNELLQDSAMVNNVRISDIIKNNIFSDYRNGINTAELTCICDDYFDINGKKVKSWAKGEIIQVGDIVRIDKDDLGNSAIKYANGKDIYFKVVGRTFRKDGIPLLDLELQEVKQLPQDGGLYSDSDFTIKIASWDELIDNGTISVSEDYSILQKANTNIDGYLKISSLVKEIKTSAFYNCKNLKGVDFNNVEIIGDGAFESCIGLENVEIKDNVTKIGNSAFSECTNLKSVSLGNGITKIDGLFYGCSSLSSISLPSSITRIEGYSFAECRNLANIILNDGLKSIGDGAFQGCSISTITIPSTVKYIYSEAFMDCSKLQNAVFEKLTGWRASDYSNYYDVNVSNSTTNATYLTQTYLADWINDEV